MKVALLVVFSLTLAFEASAQRRPGPGGNRNGGTTVRGHRQPAPGPGRVIVRDHRRSAPRPGRVVVRPGHRPNPGRVVVRPRYVRNPHSRRVVRTHRRPVIVWDRQFGYSCNAYAQLSVNGQFLHNFQSDWECQQATQDIRSYGDFCDGEDLYDQTGVLEAQYTYDYECREALGYYY